MLFSILGLLVLSTSFVILRADRRRFRNGQRADAEVVGMQQTMRHGQRQPPHPVVRFRTPDGKEVEAATIQGGDPPPARRGDRVRVIYQPGTGGDVIIDNFTGRGLHGVIILAVIGLGLMAFGISEMVPHSGRGPELGMLVTGVCFGGVCLAVGVVTLRHDRRLVRHGRQADAEVVDVWRKEARGHWAYYAVVRFRTPEGEDVETQVGGTKSSPRPGDQVRIRYEIGYPEHAALDTSVRRRPVMSAIPFFIVVLGVLAYTIFQLAR